jgi:Domain of Unknown Function (DUF1540).
MEAPNMPVKCSVDNCHFNQSMTCHAKALEVNAMGDGKAHTSDGTSCTTFKNKE